MSLFRLQAGDGLGVRLELAAGVVEAGDVVLQVPRASFATAASPGALCDWVRGNPGHSLARRTVEGAGRGWFLDAWSDAAVDATGCGELVGELRAQARQDCAGMNREVFWGVRSRCFLDLGGAVSLVPGADMLDHDCTVAASACEMTPHGLAIFATRRIAANQPVPFSYGENLSNEDLLLSHGFCCLGNPSDTVCVRGVGSKQMVELSAGNSQPAFELFRSFVERNDDLDELVARLYEAIPVVGVVDVPNPTERHFAQVFRTTKRQIVQKNVDLVRDMKGRFTV